MGYLEWRLFSKFRCFHSALMLKYKRLSAIDFYQDERKVVNDDLRKLFEDKTLSKSLEFTDEELTFYEKLNPQSEEGAREGYEMELYKHGLSKNQSKDPNLEMINRRNIDDIDLKSEQKEEKKAEYEGQQDDEEDVDKEGEERLYVPFEEGLFLLIDENFFVIDCNDQQQR